MKKIFIVPGWDGSPDKDWMPWATDALLSAGFDVACLDMPHPENPTIRDWVDFLRDRIGDVDEDVYLIGHSIGCQAIMRYLESVDAKAGGAFFVAGWFDLENLEDAEAEEIARPWLESGINLEKVRQNLGFISVLLGDDDEWVPFAKTKEKFENLLGAEVVAIPGGGHISSDSGFGPLPQLLKLVLERAVE